MKRLGPMTLCCLHKEHKEGQLVLNVIEKRALTKGFG